MVKPPPPPPEEPAAAPSLTEKGAVRLTLTDQIRWLEQELAQRRAAYPLMLQRGQITPERAERDLAVLACLIGSMRVFAATAGTRLPPRPPNTPPELEPIVVWADSAKTRQELLAVLQQASGAIPVPLTAEKPDADPLPAAAAHAGDTPARAASKIRRAKSRRP